jgi:rhodopsin domain-containing protein
MVILVTVAVSMGWGKHQYDLDIANANTMSVIGLASVTFAIAGQSWSKTSWALTLLRVSESKWQTWFIWFAIVSMNVFFGIGALLFWVQCTPLEASWHPLVHGVCWDPWINVKYGIFASSKSDSPSKTLPSTSRLTKPDAGFSGFMDLLLALLPWKIVLGLQMKKKEKFGVAVAMSMSILLVIYSHLPSTCVANHGLVLP